MTTMTHRRRPRRAGEPFIRRGHESLARPATRAGRLILSVGPAMAGVVVAVLALTLATAPRPWRVPEPDWSEALVASRRPDPVDLTWGYQAAFYLSGLYQVTRRSEQTLSTSVREGYWRDLELWAMAHVEPNGSLVD